jgi:DNA mismatch repair protein MutS
LPDARPKTLFATHYHELNELAAKHDRIKNFNIATKEVDNNVVFLRTLVEGGSQHSFGIHVAKMASMPNKIVHRAAQILIELEKKSINKESSETLKHLAATPTLQLDMFQPAIGQAIIDDMNDINVETMTPVECMMKLIELKSKVDKQ